MKELKPQDLIQRQCGLRRPINRKPVMIHNNGNGNNEIQQHEEVEESLSIMDKEKELICKSA